MWQKESFIFIFPQEEMEEMRERGTERNKSWGQGLGSGDACLSLCVRDIEGSGLIKSLWFAVE